jgi:hypothetical protein
MTVAEPCVRAVDEPLAVACGKSVDKARHDQTFHSKVVDNLVVVGCPRT